MTENIRKMPVTPHKAMVLAAGLGAKHSEAMFVDRGLGVEGRNLRLRSHRTESHEVAEEVVEQDARLAI